MENFLLPHSWVRHVFTCGVCRQSPAHSVSTRALLKNQSSGHQREACGARGGASLQVCAHWQMKDNGSPALFLPCWVPTSQQRSVARQLSPMVLGRASCLQCDVEAGQGSSVEVVVPCGGFSRAPSSQAAPPTGPPDPLLLCDCRGPHILVGRGSLETGPVDANTRVSRHRKRGLTSTVITTALLPDSEEEQVFDV